MILCTLVTESEVANGKDVRVLNEMQLGTRDCGKSRPKIPVWYLCVAYLSISFMSGVLAGCLGEQFLNYNFQTSPVNPD